MDIGILTIIANFISMIFSKGKAAPIVEALVPHIIPAITEAEQVFGPGNGEQKLLHAQNSLKNIVNAGLEVSTGGQKHTFEELNNAMPIVNNIISETVALVKNYKTVTSQPDIVTGTTGQ